MIPEKSHSFPGKPQVKCDPQTRRLSILDTLASQGRAGRARPLPILLAILLATVAGLAPANLRAQVPEVKTNLLETAAARKARQALMQSASFSWDQQPLRMGLEKLSQTYQIGIWCDRRIDPNQLVSFAPAQASGLEASLLRRMEQLAAEMAAEVGVIENLLFLGPVGEVQRIQFSAQVLHDAVSQQDPALGNASRTLSWPELSTHQQLLNQVQQAWDIRVEGQLPHDLLHAGKLYEPTSLATQLSILAGGFGLSASAIGQRGFQLSPLPQDTRWKATYARSGLQTAQFAALRGLYSGSQLQARANNCTLLGVTNFHALMLAPPGSNRQANPRTRVWSFQVENAPTSAIMEKLASSLGVELGWDPACTAEQQGKLQSLDIRQATTEALLNQICDAADLQYRLGEKTLFLQPKPRP